ncbi:MULTISPECIES: hypothetical protein [Streptomyces]|uniref:Secreted protein n=1 Tax=Streptomyces eurythermus TaxID=42237 RepID=A0ABW6Z4Q1_9ACTN|nr:MULTISPECIES: hypothetical protein [Streptomyces]QIS73150.1 hypothetical protein HB370_26850 [Streptomyces sp. DSM 40868]
MNGRRVRLAVLAPLAVSSLALGAVTFSAPTATAASPTCSVRNTDNPNNLLVSGKDFKPNKSVAVESANGAEGNVKADATGRFSLTVTDASGTISAQQIGGPVVGCGTAEEGEQKNAKEQYREGFDQGFASVKKNCNAQQQGQQQQQQGIAPVDENFQRGFKDGADAAANRFCKR